MNRRHVTLWMAFALAVCAGEARAGQDSNILQPVDSIEHRLLYGSFEVVSSTGSRFEGDRTQRTILAFPDGKRMGVKWAKAPRGGGKFNNRPRYELAAYELQKLFLDESEYVVPPTVVRCFPVSWYRSIDDRARPTFRNWDDVMTVLTYWLWNTDEDFYDEDRFEEDSEYAHHLANFNVFTYLIRHNDSNRGNYLISADPTNPRVFAVDNGLILRSEISDRGYEWRELRVKRVPRSTVERLREIDEETLHRRLGVVAQFEEQANHLVPTEPTENLRPNRGMRYGDRIVQLGLTEREIEDVYDRIRELLEKVDEGEIETF